MCRTIVLCSFMFAFIAIQANQSIAQQRTADPVLERLDEVLKRLEKIEARIEELEDLNRDLLFFWNDDRGILRMKNGRPVGFWGIDDIPTTTFR